MAMVEKDSQASFQEGDKTEETNSVDENDVRKRSEKGNSSTLSRAESKSEEKSDNESVSRSSSIESDKSEKEVLLPQHQYNRDQLLKMSKLSCLKKWPPFLDSSFSNNSGLWDPEKWFKSKRRSESPLIDDLRSKRPSEFDPGSSFKRRTPDPKERIKEERDDIVLSPQRRSFVTGCHVSAQTSSYSSRRPNSPSESRDSENIHRDSRRIGSGRIVSRDREWDKDHRERDYGYGSSRNRFDRDDREKDCGRYTNRYRSNDRRISRGHDRIEEEEEPEWFSGGPTSQHETIELVGFDENSADDRKSGPRNRRGFKDSLRRQSSTLSQLPLTDRSLNSQHLDVPVKLNPEPVKTETVAKIGKPEPVPVPTPVEISEPNDATLKKDFDLNDIFKIDFLPGLLPNGTPPESCDAGLGGSRFSQWFNRADSPLQEALKLDEQRASIQEEIGAQLRLSPSDLRNPAPNYFVNSSVNSSSFPQGAKTEKNILEILQNANINVGPLLNNEDSHSASLKEQARSGNVKNVEELEADLQQLVLGNKRASDKSAFNKLLNQMSDSSGNGPPMSMGPMDKSKAFQEVDLIHNMYSSGASVSPKRPNVPTHVMPDLRVSPSHRMSGNLMDLFDLDKPVQQGPPSVKENREQGSVVELLRNWSDQSSGQLGDVLSHMMTHQPQHTMQNHFQPERLSASFQNKPKPNTLNDLLSQSQQPRQKFVPPLAPYSHLLPPSPTPETSCLSVPLPMGAHLSPRQSPLSHDLTAVQGRIPSPLVFGQQPPVLSHAPAPIHPSQGPAVGSSSSNTLQVQNPAVPRVPSPQELAAHTQNILQNALIKRKLEEQKENFRKRQEAQSLFPLRAKSPNIGVIPTTNVPKPVVTTVTTTSASSPSKTYTSAVPAFTPTSVMRKMHSEKQDKEGRVEGGIVNNHGGSPEHKPNHQDSVQLNGPASSHNQDLMQRALAGHMPRAVHGNGYNQSVSFAAQQASSNYGMSRPLAANVSGQGRPIVKGGQSGDHGRDLGGWNPNKMAHNKPYMVPNSANILRSEVDPAMLRLVEQQRLQQQQQQAASQRNVTPMAPQAGFPMGGPRGPPPVISHQNMLRPNNANLNLLRSMVQAQNTFHPTIRGTPYRPHEVEQQPHNVYTAPGGGMNQLSQLAALQQQQQQAAQQRKALDSSRQIRNFHPLAIQQLLLQTHTAMQAPGLLPLNNNMAAGRNADNAFVMKSQGLLPPNPSVNRHSPVNLARWFGNDVLKQKMPDMPPVPMQNALSVEELERQHAAAVHN